MIRQTIVSTWPASRLRLTFLLRPGPERLPSGNYSASPILADGKIYVTTEEEGITTVYRGGPKFEILSSNKLAGDVFCTALAP